MESKEYTLAQVKENDGQNGKRMLVIIDDKVYDVTDYQHPGGREVFEDSIGEDRLDEFNGIGHSSAAKNEMKKYCVGKLVTNLAAAVPISDDKKVSEESKCCIQ